MQLNISIPIVMLNELSSELSQLSATKIVPLLMSLLLKIT